MENNSQNTENIDLKGAESFSKMSEDKILDDTLKGQINDLDIPAEPAGGTAPPAEKTFKQSDLDEIINKRISRVHSKHSKELEDMANNHKEQLNILELKYKALQEEYKTYKVDVEFHKEQKQLSKLGISKEAINSLKAIKLLGDENTYNTLREALVSQCLKGTTPKVGITQNKVNTKKVSFLD